MFEKCSACNSRILLGGEEFLHWRFCSDACSIKFKTTLVERMVAPEELEKQVQQVFEGECPQCGQARGNDLFSSTTVTGMVLMYRINSETQLCCASCARMNRLKAAAHCLVFGWWSPRALLFNLFVLPSNLIALLFVRKPEQASAGVTSFVKLRLAEALAPQMAAGLPASGGSAEGEEPVFEEEDGGR